MNEKKYDAMESILIYFHLKHNGDFQKSIKSLEAKEKFDKLEYEKLLSNYKDKRFIPLLSDDYPQAIKDMATPPLVLTEKDLENIKLRMEEIESIKNYFKETSGVDEFFDALGNVNVFGEMEFNYVERALLGAHRMGIVDNPEDGLKTLSEKIFKRFTNEIELEAQTKKQEQM